MKRGEIWWASLPEPSASEPGYRRPVLVISDDTFNSSRISTVVCVALTSSTRLAAAPGNVAVRASDAGLSRDSVVNVSQVITINKTHLTDRVGVLGKGALMKVESGLKLVLGL